MGAPSVLITGGAQGIGLAIARQVVGTGAAVILWDMDVKALERASDELGPKCRGQCVDISDQATVARAETAPDFAPTHLVNNAGILGRRVAFDAMDAEDIDRTLGVNLRGTLLVTAAFLRRRASHQSSAIVNMTSIAGTNGGAPGHAVYGASKGAMLALTKAMARDLAPDVRVNAVAPGIIDTDIQKTLFADRQALEAMRDAIPLARLGTPDDVAKAATWLLFDAAYVTGETLTVAGGRR